jgi:hypothetical protein
MTGRQGPGARGFKTLRCATSGATMRCGHGGFDQMSCVQKAVCLSHFVCAAGMERCEIEMLRATEVALKCRVTCAELGSKYLGPSVVGHRVGGRFIVIARSGCTE